jgi:hypothetical protein
MGVPVHQPRHQYRAAAVHDLIASLRGNLPTNSINRVLHYAQLAGLDLRRVKLNEQRIVKIRGHAVD